MPTPRLPAEWEKQSGIIIAWPHKNSDWVDSLPLVEATYLALTRAITDYEKLVVIVYDESLQKHVKSLLNQEEISLDNIIFSISETNDTWLRDSGPICLDKQCDHILNFRFNGWGNKFDASKDNAINQALFEYGILKTEHFSSPEFILEGGSIESDGKGTLLTTSACLLTDTRNTLYSKDNISQILENTLGINKILWLDHGYLAGDDTDSHIDMLARFIDSETIAYIECTDKSDEHFDANQAMREQLETFTNNLNKPYKLVPLPFSKPVLDSTGRRLPASYANFLIINNAVLLPVYDDENDKKAIEIMKNCFPDRNIIPIPFRHMIEQNGSLHCLTMQIPEGYL